MLIGDADSCWFESLEANLKMPLKLSLTHTHTPTHRHTHTLSWLLSSPDSAAAGCQVSVPAWRFGWWVLLGGSTVVGETGTHLGAGGPGRSGTGAGGPADWSPMEEAPGGAGWVAQSLPLQDSRTHYSCWWMFKPHAVTTNACQHYEVSRVSSREQSSLCRKEHKEQEENWELHEGPSTNISAAKLRFKRKSCVFGQRVW